MTWTKLSDDYADDTWTLTDGAYRLHTDALIWSNRKLLDLVIPFDDITRLTRSESVSESVSELLSKGFWTEHNDGYLIRHHGIYQRTRDQVLKQQSANRENGARGGRARKPGREQPSEPLTESLTQSLSERDGTGRDWKPTTAPTEVLVRTTPTPPCYHCQRAVALGTPCQIHRGAVA